MPNEKINECRTSDEKQLEVSWNRIGWVQLSVGPQQWETTSDKFIIDLQPEAIDKLFMVLKKAKRQAYANGARHWGFADSGPVEVTVDGRRFVIPTLPGRMTTSQQILSVSGLASQNYDLLRQVEGEWCQQTKDNPYVLDGGEEYITARISGSIS